MANLEQLLAARFREAIRGAFGEEHAGTDPVIRPTQDPQFGDYQANVAMGLGRRMDRSPREVAAEIVGHLEIDDLCDPPEVAGPGFINLTFTGEFLARQAAGLAADPRLGVEPVEGPERVVVEYSSPNAAREMHVGHLRSTVIGDALARIVEFLGHRVIRQNHVGDWGTQFGMLVEYLIDTGRADQVRIEDLNALYREAQERFRSDEEFAERARKRVVALQGGDERTLEIWRRLLEESERHFEEIYRRLGVTLDREHVRGESSYNPMLPQVVAELEEAGLTTISDGAVCVFPPGFTKPDGEPLPLIVQKSDGGYLYATTDLAALRYRITELGADRIVYVVDHRQSQHFAMVFAVAEMAGWLEGGVRPEHCSFGAVLGEDGKPFRTREGGVVKLSDLIDEAGRRAAEVVVEKDPDLDDAERERVARAVAVGALKHADLSNDRVKDYVFSWERMLALDGNTAPYLQYAYARIRSIFRRGDLEPPSHPDPAGLRVGHPAERSLVLSLSRLPGTVRAVEETLQPHRLCTHLYELAVAFSAFYEQCPVLRAEEPERTTRLVLCDLTARALELGLGLLGIEVLERM